MLTGRSAAAPKDFTVYGYEALDGKHAVNLGTFSYDTDGKPAQTFVAEDAGVSVSYVKLEIASNHGFDAYTCLYRFSVF
jgi:hypothetical protein